MRRWSCLVAAVVAVLAGGSVARAQAPQVTDPCGDVATQVLVDGEEQLPHDPLSPHYDIATASLSTVWSDDLEPEALGVDVVLQLCDQVEMPLYEWQWYALDWSPVPECGTRLRLRSDPVDDDVSPSTPVGEFSQQCGDTVGGSVTFHEDLVVGDDVLIDGARLTFRLRYDQLGDAAVAAIAPGRRIDAPTAWASGLVSGGGRAGASVNETGAFVGKMSDVTQAGAAFTVGEDRPPR